RADRGRARELRAGDLPARGGGELPAGLAAGAPALPRPGAACAALGLRLRGADRAHAGHRRGLRPADPADLRALLPHAARAADAVRRPAALPRDGRRPLLALAVPADRRPRRADLAPRRPAAAGAHCDVFALQLLDAAGDVVGGAMTVYGFISQLLEIIVAPPLAPLLTGWVNQWRAWFQNKTPPSLFLPYRTLHKLFNKESVLAEHASSVFRSAPYIVFGCMALAAAIVPSLSTDLPLS